MIALTFVLTIEDRERFQKSRDVGYYVGLRPKRSESGERQAPLGISKEGDVYLRKLLVQGAHCVLAQRAPDTDLKRWGAKLATRGGKNAKKRAIVAVARKLASAASVVGDGRSLLAVAQQPSASGSKKESRLKDF